MSILPNTPIIQPADFSVLQRTILDILNVNEHDRDIIWNSFENLSFTSLEIFSNKLAKLRHRGIYINETLDYILPLTINYIRNIWDNDADFNEVMDRLLYLIRRLLQKEVFLQTNIISSDKKIFPNIRLSLLDGLIISHTFIPQELVYKLHEYRISRWTELSGISELEIINRFGANFRSISLLGCLWSLYPLAENLIKKLLPILHEKQIHCSFELVIEKFALNVEMKKREREIFFRRRGWMKNGNDEPETLDTIGQCMELTRERVRQIEKKVSSRFSMRKSFEEISPFWIIIDSFLQESLGIMSFMELAEKLKVFFNWEQSPSRIALNNLILYGPGQVVRKGEYNKDENFVFSNSFSCSDCNSICSYLLELVSLQGHIDINDAVNSLNNFCKTKCPKEHKPFLGFTRSFVCYLINDKDSLNEGIVIKADCLYSKKRYEICFGRTNSLAENILQQNGKAMHYLEVYNEVKKYRPDDHSISEHNIHAHLTLCENVLLWRRGVYIHKKNVVFPDMLIGEIEKWIKVELEQKIPFISVTGVFTHFRRKCINVGIVSDYALYSCLRLSENPLYEYPKYPRIYRSNDSISQSVSLPVVIEEYVKDAYGPVLLDDIREYVVNTLHLKECMLTQYLDRAPNVVRFDRGMYIHTDYLKTKEQDLDDIITFAKKLLLEEKHISVNKVFDGRRIECKMAGIDNSVMLYSLLQLYAEDEIETARYPVLQLKNKAVINKTGILKEIAIFIRKQNTFCTYQQLEDYFVNKLGYSAITVYCASSIDGIYKYLPSCLVHNDILEWSDDKQNQLEEIALKVYTEADLVGDFYGLVSFVIEDSSLPVLGNNLYWTVTLIADLLNKKENFRVIGSKNNAFVPFPNKYEIESFEDLLFVILKNKYDGAVNLNDFIEDLHGTGVIKKRITQNMLGESKKITIVGQEIILTELI